MDSEVASLNRSATEGSSLTNEMGQSGKDVPTSTLLALMCTFVLEIARNWCLISTGMHLRCRQSANFKGWPYKDCT